MSSVAIILARGGSKRIPNKNIKNFCGAPLLSYPLKTALSSKCFDEVMVSTDSTEIAEIAKSLGAKVPFLRSPSSSNDHATTMDALKEVLIDYQKQGKSFDSFCCLYPAAVMITCEDLILSQQMIVKTGADFLTTVVPFEYPIQRALSLDSSSLVKMNNSDVFNKRSQDLEVFFHDAGQFYWGQASSLVKYNSFWHGVTVGYTLNPLKAQDIDTLADWELAEFKFSFSQR